MTPSDLKAPTTLVRVAMILGLVVVFTFYGAIVLSWLLGLKNGVARGGAPLFYDYATFRQAGLYAVEGHASHAYDDTTMIAAELASFPGSTMRLPWNYPPTFQFMLMPFAAMPYVPGFITFSIAGFLALLIIIWRYMPDLPLAFAILAPGIFVNLLIGQNGLISLSLLVLGVSNLKHRPVIAGIILGFLAFKPQLALGVPIALLARRSWRALFAAAASQAAFSVAVAVVLGVDCWRAFLSKATHPAAIVSGSSSSWDAVPSLGVLTRQLGGSVTISNLAQLAGAALATTILAHLWSKDDDDPLVLMAVLGAASVLIAPYLRPYDLILLLPVTAVACRDWRRAGLPLKAAGIMAWLSPALLMFTIPPLQYGALVSLMGLLCAAN